LEYLIVEDESVFFKRAKYIGVKYMAWYLKQEQPEAPPVDFNHTGKWRRWARSRRFTNRKNTHLWYSVLQAKRCALPLTKEMVLATYVKHRKAMNLEDPIDDDTLESVFKELRGVLEPIREALTKSYGSDSDLDNLAETSWAPSQSAAYETSRSDGGQKEFLRETIENCPDGQRARDEQWFDRCDIQADPSVRIEPELLRMQFYTKIVINGQVFTNIVVEYLGYPRVVSLWDEALSEAILQVDTGRPLRCEIYGILEPLKVRVISKGESIPYYASKELQKRLHTVLRRMDCFRLIGRPLCPTDLMDCAQNPVQTGEGQHLWFSVDYSSATDCLSAALSAKILNFLTEDLPERMREIWRKVLAPHWCEYPPVKLKSAFEAKEFCESHPDLFPKGHQVDSTAAGDEQLPTWLAKILAEKAGKMVTLPPTMQKNGQLMGSPLSFPILCLANLGLYLEVIKDDPRPLSEKLKGVLVNGDDMLYVAPESLWDKHVSLGNRVGLIMTPGKAYKHRVFANANSTCFHYDLGNENATPWQIDFLNTGLLFGQNKVLQKDTGLDEDEQSNAVSVINQLLKGALPGRQKSLFKSYLNRHKEKISKECAGRNLFIHTSLGGMGVTPPLGWSWKFTERQRVSASARVAEMGPYADFGCGPRRAPTPIEFMQDVHPYMFREGADQGRVHSSNPKIVKEKTLLKTSLLKQPVYLVGEPSPFWKRAFYRSGLVTYQRKELKPLDFQFDALYFEYEEAEDEGINSLPSDDPFVVEFEAPGTSLERKKELSVLASEWSGLMSRCLDYSYQEVHWDSTLESEFRQQVDSYWDELLPAGPRDLPTPNFW
jgi:hypothetical protein